MVILHSVRRRSAHAEVHIARRSTREQLKAPGSGPLSQDRSVASALCELGLHPFHVARTHCVARIHVARIPGPRNSGASLCTGGTHQSENPNSRYVSFPWPFFVPRSCMLMGLTQSGSYFEGVKSSQNKGTSQGDQARGILVRKTSCLRSGRAT